MRPGFTLLEILVAVTIAAALLLAADAVFEQLADSRMLAARAELQRDGAQNAREVIGRLVRQVDVSPQAGAPGTTHGFLGDSVGAQFTSSCIAPGGWERECQVTLRIASDSTGVLVVAVTSTGDSASLRTHDGASVIRYLMDASGGGHWATNWPGGPTPPIAIGIASRTDTLLLRLGERG